MNAENFNAFRSFNYPVLASAGIHIKYNNVQIHTHGTPHELEPHYLLDTNIAILKLFPGIQENVVAAILATKGLKAVVLENLRFRQRYPERNGFYATCMMPANKASSLSTSPNAVPALLKWSAMKTGSN